MLVVDDDAATAALLAFALTEQGGFRVDQDTSAASVLNRIVAGERFDAIISDIAMPAMSGIELHAALWRVARDQAMRMIFMSGGLTRETAEYLGGLPNVQLVKPLDTDLLRVALRRLARAKEAPARL